MAQEARDMQLRDGEEGLLDDGIQGSKYLLIGGLLLLSQTIKIEKIA